MRDSERAWIALGVGVAVYEMLAQDGELLSHQVDRWLERHPVITTTAVVVTSLHLLNLIPPKLDPFVWVFSARRKQIA